MCSDGIDQKSTAHIPELPEAAVAKVGCVCVAGDDVLCVGPTHPLMFLR